MPNKALKATPKSGAPLNLDGRGLMVPVYSPLTESEAAVISAMLEAHGIHFFIRGGAFSKLYPGMQIKDYNTQTFMVPEESYELARDLLAEFIKPRHKKSLVLPKNPFGVNYVF